MPLMSKDEIIERLCLLSESIYYKIDPLSESPNDCFCTKGGLWGMTGYDGTVENGFRNSGKVLEFIESAVKEKLETMKG